MSELAFSRPSFGREEEEAVAAVVRSGWVVGGPRLRLFEHRFAALCQAPHAVGVSSWTAGAFLVLKALGIGPGDEVIVPSLTFIASVNAIAHTGARPVFADINSATFNIDPDDVARKIGPRTRAILPVDQLGLPCEIDAVLMLARRHNLIVVQDAACALGSRYRGRPVGGLAPITVFSLHARKVVTTGEGGMIVTFDGALSERLARLRHQAMTLSDFDRRTAPPTLFESYPEVGYNFRLTDIQAAIGLVQLGRLPDLLEKRGRVAERYRAALRNHPFIDAPSIPVHAEPNWQSFQVRVRPCSPLSRNAIMETLHAAGIPTRRGVMASHREPPYADGAVRLPHTDEAADRCLQLPMHAGLNDAGVERVIEALGRIS